MTEQLKDAVEFALTIVQHAEAPGEGEEDKREELMDSVKASVKATLATDGR